MILKNQLTILPNIFHSEIPDTLAKELKSCKTDADAKKLGIEWSIQQCKELMDFKVPSIHFYSYMASDSVYEIAKAIY